MMKKETGKEPGSVTPTDLRDSPREEAGVATIWEVLLLYTHLGLDMPFGILYLAYKPPDPTLSFHQSIGTSTHVSG